MAKTYRVNPQTDVTGHQGQKIHQVDYGISQRAFEQLHPTSPSSDVPTPKGDLREIMNWGDAAAGAGCES